VDGSRFDLLTRILATSSSRRRLLAGLASGALGLTGVRLADARTCTGLGSVCRAHASCCSGSCGPKDRTGRRRCGCATAADCPAPGPCLDAVCVTATGRCETRPSTNGTACNDRNACTQNDTCQNGVCVGGNPVVCTPLDQCHDAGTCNPKTGACSNPDKADGVPCNDTNACTLGDTCQGGVCTGGSQVACVNINPCVTDFCDPAIGCTTTPREAGTACDDFFRCDGSEVCDGKGNCVEGTPVTCDECNACDASTGTCAPANDGETCTGDGNRCYGAYVCQGGSCVGEQPVICEAANQCHDVGVCEPTTGLCSNPNKADDTVCGAGDGCATGTCQSGDCTVTTCCTPGATRSCYTGPAGTENIGICHGGTQTCAEDGSLWGPCADEVTPQGSYFYCNGLDNDCDGRIESCPPNFSCQNGICFGNSGGTGCFAAGARVTMADGSTKAIETVRVGDLVRGRGGAANRVNAIETPWLGDRPLYAVNDGAFLVTASHPFHTLAGLKSIDPAATAREPRGLAVDRLMMGDELLGDWDERDTGPDGGHPRVSLRSIVAHALAPDTQLYNLYVAGDGTHTIGGVLFEEK
jgi:hypothetical protein